MLRALAVSPRLASGVGLLSAAVLLLLLFSYVQAFRGILHVPAPDSGSAKKRSKTEVVNVRLPTDYYTRSIPDFYSDVIDRWFAPWDCLNAREDHLDLRDTAHEEAVSLCERPITAASISALEFNSQWHSYRIRYTERKELLYRRLQVSPFGYQAQRANWTLNLLQEMAGEGLLTQTSRDGTNTSITFDAVFHWGDEPAVVKDTLDQNTGYLIFGMFSSDVHLDIPMPNMPAYGSNGNYVWPARDQLVPWSQKVPQLVFRGQVTFKFGVDNWQTSPRIRLAQLAKLYPNLFDIDNTAYRVKALPPYTRDPTAKDPTLHDGIFLAPTVEDVVRKSNLTVASKMTFIEQSGYKYLLDVDGGLGSSRVMATLASGSVPFLVESGWYNHIQQSLIPWVHYVPVSEHLGDLVAKVRWAQKHERQALRIVDNAVKFAETYASRQAAKEQLAEVLRRYHNLLASDVKTDDSEVETDFCSTNTTRSA